MRPAVGDRIVARILPERGHEVDGGTSAGLESQAPSALGAAATSVAAGEERPLPLRCAGRALVGCAWRTLVLIVGRRIRQPRDNVGRRIVFADGTTSQVYRETVIDRPPTAAPAVLVVCFRLRRVRSGWAHRLFRAESELNTILFAGFPGLVSKLWLRHDEQGRYRGFYQWDGAQLAVVYVRALWWVLALVSEPQSIHYAVLPGVERDQVLADPAVIDEMAAADGGWWRPESRWTKRCKRDPNPRSRPSRQPQSRILLESNGSRSAGRL